jgi:hypothetical protein
MFTQDELNKLATCIDAVIRRDGVAAVPVLFPLFQKLEQAAKDLEAPKSFDVTDVS